MRRLVFGTILVWAGLLLLPAVSRAQGTSTGSIAGTAKDSSGAVLPGVTVEASSPALIEKIRTTITDDKGEYKIIELRPGTYTVTFTLTGFNTFKRDGLELAPNFTATINAVLAVGAIQETVTVSGSTPLVDTQNVSQQRTFSKELLDAVPTAKSLLGSRPLMPSVVEPPNAQDVGGSKGERSVRLSVHGSKTYDCAAAAGRHALQRADPGHRAAGGARDLVHSVARRHGTRLLHQPARPRRKCSSTPARSARRSTSTAARR